MLDKQKINEFLPISDEIRPSLMDLAIKWKFPTYIDILFVVDTEIATQPGVGFGVGSVIEFLRGASVGCLRFRVDIALRNGEDPTVIPSPAPFGPKYRGFRFHMKDGAADVIDKYEQIWCFGFKPSNSGSTNDAEIDQPIRFPSSNDELAKLAAWMDQRKGGLFGTGDHHFLGASMCRRIPRLGTMRRWTNADGVPPIGTPGRIDTLRPPSSAYMPGAPGGPLGMDNTPHQGDNTPQPIQWVAWQTFRWPLLWRKRPHPVLCHPTLGPIDVMPDHAHEGLCVETADIPANGTYNFDGKGKKQEYPGAIAGGTKPLPQIIAYGSTLGHPPYNFVKGPQPARPSFPMISVYDGHLAGVGRVATDSTWHHWMDVNIAAFKAANSDVWKKISRYFLNLAVWLNPPDISANCFRYSAVMSHFQYPGYEEYRLKRPMIELGEVLRRHLSLIYGPCWVTERIWWELVLVRKLWPWELLKDLKHRFEFGGIDPQIIENTYLGSMVEASFGPANEVKAAVQVGKIGAKLKLDDQDKTFSRSGTAAMKKINKEIMSHYNDIVKLLKSLP